MFIALLLSALISKDFFINYFVGLKKVSRQNAKNALPSAEGGPSTRVNDASQGFNLQPYIYILINSN